MARYKLLPWNKQSVIMNEESLLSICLMSLKNKLPGEGRWKARFLSNDLKNQSPIPGEKKEEDAESHGQLTSTGYRAKEILWKQVLQGFNPAVGITYTRTSRTAFLKLRAKESHRHTQHHGIRVRKEPDPLHLKRYSQNS